MLEGAKLIGAGAATIALAGAAVGIGNVFSSLIHSVVRNPSLAKQLFFYVLFCFALTEAIALFALMMAFFFPTSLCWNWLLWRVFFSLWGPALSCFFGWWLGCSGFLAGALSSFARAIALGLGLGEICPNPSIGKAVSSAGTGESGSSGWWKSLLNLSPEGGHHEEQVGSPSVSSEFPSIRMSTPEFLRMVGDSDFSSAPGVPNPQNAPANPVAFPGAGEPSPIRVNISLEASITNRIENLTSEKDTEEYTKDVTFFLGRQTKSDYLSLVKKTLRECSSQGEYGRILESENRDLQIREKKIECYSLFSKILSENSPLRKDAAYEPREAFADFFAERRDELDKKPEWDRHLEEKDRIEIQFVEQVHRDLLARGAASSYIQKLLGNK